MGPIPCNQTEPVNEAAPVADYDPNSEKEDRIQRLWALREALRKLVPKESTLTVSTLYRGPNRNLEFLSNPIKQISDELSKELWSK